MDAIKLTASSGSDVPNATKVKPIASGDTLKRLAIEADDSTKKSAPFTKKKNPTNKSNTLMTCSMTSPFVFENLTKNKTLKILSPEGLVTSYAWNQPDIAIEMTIDC